jgi:subtilisin family serine protease
MAEWLVTMKIASRLLITLIAILTLRNQSLASGIIVRLADPSQIGSILLDYPSITEIRQAGCSPFVRFEVSSEIEEEVKSALTSDCRVIWAADDKRSSIRYSGHGSSVAAIYDRYATFSRNTNLWAQINFMPNRRKFVPITVGVVDTGVSPLQPDIRSNIIAGANFVNPSQTIDDMPQGLDTNGNGVFDEATGHGTMVAGLIVQMVPNTPLVIAKSADSDGIGSSWTVLQGVIYCVENGARLINISLGSSEPLAELEGVLGWVEESGALIISPIGNDASNTFLYPAGYPSVVCVTGLLPDSTKAPFSNWNTIARVSAPATGILSAWWDGGTAVWSGTSLAAPLVVGATAAALAANPTKTPAEIRDAIEKSGTNIDLLNPNYVGQLGGQLNFVNLITLLKR